MQRLTTVGMAAGLALALLTGARPVAAGAYEDAIYQACATYGCDGDTLVRVMECESGGDPYAISPDGDYGLMQIKPLWFDSYGITDWTNPYQQIDAAARMWADGLGFMWVCQ